MPTISRATYRIAAFFMILCVFTGFTLAAEQVDPKWLNRLPKEDRAAIDENLGYAPPAISRDVKWLNRDAMTWDALRGKVIVVQSFTTTLAAQRKWPTRLAGMLNDAPPDEIFLIALHTPDGADKAEGEITKSKPPENVAIVIDADGAFCDSLGIYKEPVNLVIDRNGTLRFAGLNPKGLEQAVAKLVQEKFDPAKQPTARPREQSASAEKKENIEFPAFRDKVDHARDLRGQRAPEFFVNEWLTATPDARGKVVVLDFWATWCGPCVAAIPHMNALASQFGDKICAVGISDEKQDQFEAGLKKAKLKPEVFKYALALDPGKKMKSAFGITAIPHCVVISQDWIVRWQGHPNALTSRTLDQIVKADAANAGAASANRAPKKRGWKT